MKTSIIVIEGKCYRWRDILQLRREQIAATAQREQLTLFADLPHDSRPTHERTAADRYLQPSLFTF
jgi:hypothetical protein